MSLPVESRIIGDVRRGVVKKEDTNFVISALIEYYKVLRAVGTLKAAKKPTEPKAKPLSRMNKTELLAKCSEMGCVIPDEPTNDDLIKIIKGE